MIPEGKKPTQYDFDKLFLAYEEARSDITTHFRKILELQKENEQLKAKLESEENECLKLIDERDFREEQINRIADALGDFREWSNQNDRGENCIESIEILNAKLEKAKDALRFYSLKSNYSIVDEGRNYSVEMVCYELDEVTYEDTELGTRARAALKEIEGE